MTGRLVGSGDAVAAARLLAASGRPWCWLDGEAAAPGEPRVSYFGVASEVRIAEPGAEREFLAGLRAAPERPDAPAMPGFHGGWAVALSYEFGVALLGLEPARDAGTGLPAPAFALRLDGVLAIDHERGASELRGDTSELEALLDTRLPGDLPSFGPHRYFGSEPVNRSETTATSEERDERRLWRRTDADYAREVEACRSAIRDGEAYVLCLTDTAEVRGRFDPLELFLRLRARGGAVRGGVIAAGDRALVSASPERFLSVRGRRILTHPIKGTRPRGADPEADRALAEQLAADPKERAENLMIVDLMRNDLGRVCEAGSVGVEGFLRVESHPHVHQLVSTVAGTLRAGADVFDAIEVCFPGGSMTGAPKRRAVEILRELEGAPRGLYSGCFGWVGDGGDAELAMTIRSVELRAVDGAPGLALIGAGGGITADSDPERETAEKHLKAAPLLTAVGALSSSPHPRYS
ncbi:anthranilate synthase component I family protein [Leucobacter tenebrionis]|uniref:anthranilate synthase component I family protein n=1 Tax=Leucobacter tenebrionis TaxID=2873270 RepID=UPI001CA7205A|nr:anthranilate synthase component I family protein [Leucobacter tenebrionis]QZY52280.1 anthranilate synthase component I family protein [Leucobacter tenebrionis]